MPSSAIDIHHHYLPRGLLTEAKRHGKALGVEVDETKDGSSTLSIAGGRKFVLPSDLSGLESRLSMMEKGRIAIAALEPHTSSLGYQLDVCSSSTVKFLDGILIARINVVVKLVDGSKPTQYILRSKPPRRSMRPQVGRMASPRVGLGCYGQPRLNGV